ncbi:MAG: type IV secretion system lipoprotein VirB7 [Acidocella sp.]|nr:type IV secretion system lipoprotein VirB7 [Acidocella sp.]
MHEVMTKTVNNLIHLPVLLFLLWAVYRKFVSKRPLPAILAVPGRLFRLLLIIITFGLLAGCSNPDPLAVASGPLFALNAGHWQPTPRDLVAPPSIANR